MVWQLEQMKTARALCYDCKRYIRRGEHRFGNYELDRWYHLDCAIARDSRAFAPFAEAAAALMRPAQPPERRVGRIRNPEFEARLVAQPDDTATMAVFADWLQSVEDPWGELIALELEGKAAPARAVLKEHLDDLIGEFAPRMFEWRYGFIETATIEAVIPSSELPQIISDMFALRTAVILRELHVPQVLPPKALEVINTEAPDTLRHLSTWLAYNLGGLVLPSLEQLTIYITSTSESMLPDAQLPRLSRLKISGRPLPLPVLSAFLDSEMARQLTWLEITDGALDAAGEALVARRRKNLEHIPVLNFSLALDDVFPEQKAAWRARAR